MPGSSEKRIIYAKEKIGITKWQPLFLKSARYLVSSLLHNSPFFPNEETLSLKPKCCFTSSGGVKAMCQFIIYMFYTKDKGVA
jgi:hypothetical protein